VWRKWLIIPSVLVGSFFVRAVASIGWSLIVGHVYRGRKMVAGGHGDRRYAIGATGLNDGNLYAFTSHTGDGVVHAWKDDAELPVPLGERPLAMAVTRATSLPGIGQLGFRKLWLPGCDHPGPHRRKTCAFVPDMLVDGGLWGIFGRGLLGRRADPERAVPRPRLVVVDAGRRLRPHNERSLKDRSVRIGERFSGLLLLARWLTIAVDISYRGELGIAQDGRVVGDYRTRLVRIAEDELSGEHGSEWRRQQLVRLLDLRDQVHKLGLVGVTRTRAARAITVAVVACALEFEEEPDIEAILDAIAEPLGCRGELSEVWAKLRPPHLGQPV
jgi:hypothetical protein